MVGREYGRAQVARKVLVALAVLLLLPLVTTLPFPRGSAAQSVTQDSLWAAPSAQEAGGIGACANPSSPDSLATCFSSITKIGTNWTWVAIAADSSNVYFASDDAGAVSCPIADLGDNCTPILWNWQNARSVAAADGQLWIGFDSGKIYRCPATIPYSSSQTSAPSQCVLVDDAKDRSVRSLLIANGTLYAGLGTYKNQGILWSCDPYAVNKCTNLDSYGDTYATSLSAGGGYLWAGLNNGVLWRCDPQKANSCLDWLPSNNTTNPDKNPANSVSYDGQGTLYAAFQEGVCVGKGQNCPGSIKACPAQNSCSTVFSGADQFGFSVAAGAGGVFSSTTNGIYRYGVAEFTQSGGMEWGRALLLYVPAGGPSGVGGAKVSVSAKGLAGSIERRCRSNPSARRNRIDLAVTGPGGFSKTLNMGLCQLRGRPAISTAFDLLDPGNYTVTATTRKHYGTATFTVKPNRTGAVRVSLARK